MPCQKPDLIVYLEMPEASWFTMLFLIPTVQERRFAKIYMHGERLKVRLYLRKPMRNLIFIISQKRQK